MAEAASLSFPDFTFAIAVILLFSVCVPPVWVLGRKQSFPRLRSLWDGIVPRTGEKLRLNKHKVYAPTQDRFVGGRQTMLSLCAAHLRVVRAASPKQHLVWVDISGGTGHNIEVMDKYFPVSSFDAIYIVHANEALLEVARQRVAKNGWKNVTILGQEAEDLRLPESLNGVSIEGSVDFVTLSYSLATINGFDRVVDRVHGALCPQRGLVGVVDFYAHGKPHSRPDKVAGGPEQKCGWFSRWFWRVFFDFDHVCLSRHRRSRLEDKFGTVKCYQAQTHFNPFIARIPYYIWIGRPRSCDVLTSREQLKSSSSNNRTLEHSSPPTPSTGLTASRNSFRYHVGTPWRMPYYEQPIHKQFRTYIYAFTWEDPEEDMRHLQLTSADSVLAITSGGDSVLHYAISAGPKRIHCVDMNPCQGHLVELKLAAIHTLDYDDFFAMFGEGRHPNFRSLLDSKIAPHLSADAYAFWRANEDAFSSAFYLRGYSGWAIYLMNIVFKCAGVSQHVEEFCNADTLQEQDRIWWTHLRPVMLNPVVVALMKNPVFCWNALGVPLNQRKMLLNDGGVYEYIRDTLDPLPSSYLLKTGAYFYLLALLGRYTHESCPAYLTRDGFEKLKANSSQAINAFRLHTDSVVNVLKDLPDNSLTRVVVMDHLDWFPPGSPDVDAEIENLHRLLDVGGLVFWRSAARTPWYNTNFEAMGFQVTALGVRTGPKIAIDRVNMYSSFFKATKVA
ncbi:S-adenosyl-L-methionine-dependent methyltransferase [Mycena filopes]|nr:S-adenosyl-L-methionine-dependent methyltransferase [Mycena filopes]